ncbi:MAG: cytochrome c family protein, partial [Gammaproteobacteria bacterium]|nr:cytochrome c family protein [Gammaproteobacteria bacterium]
EIDAIFDYMDGYTDPVAAGGDTAAGGASGPQQSEGVSIWWFIIGGVLLIVLFSAASIRRQLAHLQMEKDGEKPDNEETYLNILKNWAWKNQEAVGVIGFVCLFAFLAVSYGWLKGVGVYENYHPSQPITAFSHNIHADINGIDCQTCHYTATKSKHAGIPTANICMTCHKSVEGASDEGKKSIAMLHEAAGYDPNTGSYTGETKPLIWNRVYVLPDHAYFNHSQHVEVGGLECQNCHGPVEKMTTAYLAPVEELIPVGGNPDNKLTRPTLTMGWCIECHNNLGVNLPGNGAYYEEMHRRLKKNPEVYKKYLDDEKVTVRELGGWECSKCHY